MKIYWQPAKSLRLFFLSSDNTKEEFDKYFASMVTEGGKKQFLALEYEWRDLAKDLKQVFEVSGIPTLVLLKPDGTIVCEDARDRVMKYGAETFPWDNASVEKHKEILLKREKDTEEAHRNAGHPVIQRIRGEPGSVIHEPSGRSIALHGSFVTAGVPERIVESGVLYYELEFGDGMENSRCTQFGFSLGDGIEKSEDTMGEGVGDNDKSWGVCGVRQEAWHNGETTEFGCTWSSGDVIGFAANIDTGKIAVSKNGSWSKKDDCGVVFQDESIKEGVYPCFTSYPVTLFYNMKEEDFKFELPPADVWELSTN
jgi:hypothetical protein